MATHGWRSSVTTIASNQANTGDVESEDAEDVTDLERVARDAIARRIIARYKGHGMERLVESILQAQGYTTHHSPEGPDKGVDILAAQWPLGFGEPRSTAGIECLMGQVISLESCISFE